MNNVRIYRIVLNPLDTFFFGSEQTFGYGEESSYYAISNKYPQQTGLLGMLRQEILFQNNKDFSLIGEQSFKADGSISEFGIINRISPLLLLTQSDNSQQYFTWESREFYKYGDVNDPAFQLNILDSGCSGSPYSSQKDWVPVLKNYNEKQEITDELISCTTGEKIDNIFNEVRQVGIQKKAKENGFFKKVSYKLNPEFCFVFFVSLYQNRPYQFSNNIVMMGGDRSPFKMYVEDYTDLPNPISGKDTFYNNVYGNTDPLVRKLILISDAFVSDKLYDKALFANSDIQQFRNIYSTKGTKNYYSLQKENDSANDALYKSKQLVYLMKRGSVIYFSADKEYEIKKYFDTPAYQNVGFNHYKIV